MNTPSLRLAGVSNDSRLQFLAGKAHVSSDARILFITVYGRLFDEPGKAEHHFVLASAAIPGHKTVVKPMISAANAGRSDSVQATFFDEKGSNAFHALHRADPHAGPLAEGVDYNHMISCLSVQSFTLEDGTTFDVDTGGALTLRQAA